MRYPKSTISPAHCFNRLSFLFLPVFLSLTVFRDFTIAATSTAALTDAVKQFLEQKQIQASAIELTINPEIQNILEKALATAQHSFKPDATIGIILDPQTGGVLALAHTHIKNVPFPEVQRLLEPGGPLKIVAASAALVEKTVTADTKIDCENGVFNYNGHTIHDHHAYNLLTPAGILEHSSNIGAAKLAISVGKEKFYEYIHGFGFCRKTGVELPDESPGLLPPPKNWTNMSITSFSKGAQIATTPIQNAMAMSVIANGGKLMRPHLLRSYRDEFTGKTIVIPPEVLMEVIDRKNINIITAALSAKTRAHGSSSRARIPGVTVAGVSGTMQKFDSEKMEYSHTKHNTCFLGFLPVEKPRLVCCIWVDSPNNNKLNLDSGSFVAAPIFSEVARYSLLELEANSQK